MLFSQSPAPSRAYTLIRIRLHSIIAACPCICIMNPSFFTHTAVIHPATLPHPSSCKPMLAVTLITHALDKRYPDALVVEPQPTVTETLFLYEQTSVASSTRSKDTDASFMSLIPCGPLTTTTTTTTTTTLPKNHLEVTSRWRASITRRPHDASSRLSLPTPQSQILSGQTAWSH
ncbi:uncharacterized protein LY79DRAFT_180683 [Colletotrichum navitas]|uniref:Uncharacterized protein n=1 Tax=Colletotrichum navitas TaxID=681940 RepID=A0AAD8Q1F7_9PEZI|nr:uncharacterized protein LY79DRAFT_180683 [Colletotrichum navitas]KAK1593532.1 hypothetical protein LY79DRAFT_180683 [Colletotrichum navitas]